MVFSSLLFVYLFFALHLVIYYFSARERRNIVLLVFSLIFYAWGGPRYLILLVGDTFVSWFTARRIAGTRSRGRKKFWLVICCIALLGVLGIFKYATFILGNVKAITGVPEVIPNIVLPIGISFYTFQLLSYVVDVYRGDVEAQPRFWKLLLYSSLFHQCIAGPIVRYSTVANDIDNRHVTPTDVYEGIYRFSIGLAKKAILANSCGDIVKTLLPEGVEKLASQTVAGLWLGMLFFMLEIYLDFSAYSDMAIGMGRMVGFHYQENFNYPYVANSIQDFWRRWHMSLSSFFRDYVYIPLGGSRVAVPTYIRNMVIVWFLTGLWHGASWNYIFWGLYFLAFLLLERLVIRGRFRGILGHLYSLIVIYFGWVIFKFENLAELGTVLKGMFGGARGGGINLETVTLLRGNIIFLLVAIVAVTPLWKKIRDWLLASAQRSAATMRIVSFAEIFVPAIMLILSTLALIGDAYNPFLYFQF